VSRRPEARAIRRALLGLGAVAAVIGCESPEMTRVRGGGPSADVGNRGSIELHGGSDIYWKTPVRITELARGNEPAAAGTPSK
jgi:hypothetical protein